MDITDFLVDIATGYDRAAGVSTPTQRLLARASQHLAQHVPGGIVIKGSGGKSTATLTPWVGFFDPDETLSPQEGVYVVYIFTEDLQSVILSLQQGMENLVKTLGPGKARIRLAADAVAIRESLPPSALMGLDATIHLGSKGFRQRGYEAGSIAAIRYDVSALPSEHDLGRDLRRILNLYQLVVATKRSLLQAQPGSIASPSILQEPGGDPLKDFKPKSSEDYVTHLTGRTLSKSRRHEQLIADYGTWIAARGFIPSTEEHPKDLVLRRAEKEWVIEAKVLYQGNATDAVRAALGQLYTYRYFLCGGKSPILVGLFSEPIGHAYVEFLEACGIASVWKSTDGWVGSRAALDDLLAEHRQ